MTLHIPINKFLFCHQPLHAAISCSIAVGFSIFSPSYTFRHRLLYSISSYSIPLLSSPQPPAASSITRFSIKLMVNLCFHWMLRSISCHSIISPYAPIHYQLFCSVSRRSVLKAVPFRHWSMHVTIIFYFTFC